MERLTKRDEYNQILTQFWKTNTENGMYDIDEPLAKKCIERLAAYEDTGLAPETVAEADKTLKANWNIPLARLKEAIDFIKAKDEGRLAVDIVHCRDCKHLYFKDMSRYCSYRVGPCWPNGFCDCGERRKDKTT